MPDWIQPDPLRVRRELFRPEHLCLIVQLPSHEDRPMALALSCTLVDWYTHLLLTRGYKVTRFACPVLVLRSLAARCPLLYRYVALASIPSSGSGALSRACHPRS